ncbi:MAG: hypothetical protein NZ585_08040 [Chloracidobacterium sp.]|nr:hypothetical protein [Chloracidobacterium sp.]MDW8218039.1 hypothetical protein [Acidobacteriota bacterium]
MKALVKRYRWRPGVFMWLAATFGFMTVNALAQAGALDVTFNPGGGVSGAVYAIAVQPDGKVVIGGEFSAVNGLPRNNVARLNPDGSLDVAFDPGSGVNGRVEALLIQPDGRVVIGGAFSSVNGVPRRSLARLNADGSVDSSFTTGTDAAGVVYALARQGDGKLLIAGDFTNLANVRRERLARLNADGSVDTDFNPNAAANGPIFALAIQPNGRILLGGAFTQVNGIPRSRLARLTADGALDLTFSQNSETDGVVNALGVQPDGRILISGDFRFVNGVARGGIARLEPGGALDTTFGAFGGVAGGLLPVVYALVIQPNGRILVAGDFTTVNGTARNRIARLNPTDGSLDTGFDPGSGASSAVYALALQADGKILLGGAFASFNGTPRAGVARLLGDDPGCASAVAPTTANFSALGGDGIVTVTAAGDCTWRAVSNVPWITITGGASGGGNGTVTYRVAAHRGRQRTGMITVAGRAVTITQAVSAFESVGLFRRSDGFFYLRNSLTSGVADTAFFFGLGNDIPLSGDWDGDGTTTIGVFRVTGETATFFLKNSNSPGFADVSFPFGAPGDIPIAGDWNGDGRDTVGVFRNGVFFLRNTNSAGAPDVVVNFGLGTDVPVVGDWDGNGTTTVGCYRRANGFFYYRNDLLSGVAEASFFYGLADDIPFAGDWNGDGRDGIGVVRLTEGSWRFFLKNELSAGFADVSFNYGNAGDLPVVGNWNGRP